MSTEPRAFITPTLKVPDPCPEWPDCGDDEGVCLACAEHDEQEQATHGPYPNDSLANIKRSAQFRAALAFVEQHGLRGLEKLRRAWVVECLRQCE